VKVEDALGEGQVEEPEEDSGGDDAAAAAAAASPHRGADATGLFVFVSSWVGWVMAGPAEEQAVIGALAMLLGFAAWNAVQRT
jgi:hypothetical protein